MTNEEWKSWREHNIQVMQLGGTLSTNIMVDGTLEEYRIVCGQVVRNDPELKNALVKV